MAQAKRKSSNGGNGEPQLEDVPRQAKSLTIGAVCKGLQQEFPDISISKIRYLEDQKLITPRRTPGGYRLYSAADVARLRTILRLQRDDGLFIEDEGSLNGTFLNRRRIDSHKLEDGDELQVGKYKLTYLAR